MRRSATDVLCLLLFSLTACAIVEGPPAESNCDSSSDCEKGERCAPRPGGRGLCVDALSCTTNDDCSTGLCLDGTCREKQCSLSPGACGFYACNPVTYVCETTCNASKGCGELGYCSVDLVCVARECKFNDPDGACGGFACTNSGLCRHDCVEGTADGCVPATHKCQKGVCVPK